MEPTMEESKGPMIGIVIIVIILLLGGAYLLSSSKRAPAGGTEITINEDATGTTTPSGSSNIEEIDAELNAENFTDLDADLNAAAGEL